MLVPLCPAQGAGAARAQIQSHIPIEASRIALVSISCSATPARVFTGGVVTIQAQGRSVQDLPLRYGFAAEAGQLSTSGAAARLNTAGLGARTVHVTCSATDSAGRSASQVVEVVVMGTPRTEELHLPTGSGIGSGAKAPVVVPPTASRPAPVEEVKPPPPPPPVAADGHGKRSASVPEMPKPATPAAPAGGETAAPVHPTSGETAAPAPAPAQPAASDVYKPSAEMEAWIRQLKQGRIEYQVPPRMLLLQAATVTVVIHGYQDVNTATLPEATGSASLKQSPRMKVELLPEDDPDAFTIALENGDAVKDVLSTGATTWIWKVTPNKSGAKQRLKILASLMYPNTDKTEIQLQDYHTTVEVDVASLWSTVVDDYQHDPLKFFSYMIPGGAGFTFIAGLVVWGWKRKHKDEKE